MKYFFTYGRETHPFVGGWTEIEADNRETACKIFGIIHPAKNGRLLNCAGVYDEEEFSKTNMKTNGNFGMFCVEKAKFTWEIMI